MSERKASSPSNIGKGLARYVSPRGDLFFGGRKADSYRRYGRIHTGAVLVAVPSLLSNNKVGKGKMTGTVSKFDDQRGWGFITADSGGGDFFVHYSEVKMTGHKSLFEGERVEFEIGNSQRGPKAVNVQPLDDGPEDHVTP